MSSGEAFLAPAGGTPRGDALCDHLVELGHV
jgi:hypothetical protein